MGTSAVLCSGNQVSSRSPKPFKNSSPRTAFRAAWSSQPKSRSASVDDVGQIELSVFLAKQAHAAAFAASFRRCRDIALERVTMDLKSLDKWRATSLGSVLARARAQSCSFLRCVSKKRTIGSSRVVVATIESVIACLRQRNRSTMFCCAVCHRQQRHESPWAPNMSHRYCKLSSLFSPCIGGGQLDRGCAAYGGFASRSSPSDL